MLMKIRFKNISDIYMLVNKATRCKSDVYIKNIESEHKINGKSILGIFTLDLSQPLQIVYDDSEKELTEYLKTLEK